MRKISEYTQAELDLMRAVCNFTRREEELFLLRSREYTLDECAEKMCIGRRTVDRISHRIATKITAARNEL